jgi:hypothetical protein
VTDPTAAEAEVEAVRAAAKQRAGAAEEMAVQMTAVEIRAYQAKTANTAPWPTGTRRARWPPNPIRLSG